MVEAVTGTMETIHVTAVEDDGIEFFQINDTVLEVLPTDIMSFSDNAVYEESFIRSKAVFAFSLYKNAPAQPLAEPKTSELEKPPTAPMN